MQNLIEILQKYKARNVAIGLDKKGVNLSIKGAVHRLTQEDKKELLFYKPQLLDFFHNQRQSRRSIPQANKPKNHIPLTPAQKSIWIHDQFEQRVSQYNIPALFQFELRQFDPARFRLALQQLVQRQEVLRYVFRMQDGEPFQSVQEVDLDKHLLEEDLREHPEASALVQEKVEEFLSQTFSLQERPPWKLVVFRLTDVYYQFYLQAHHLIADGDSLQILFLELMQLYQGKSLAPLSIQFSDFAHWIRQKNQFTASADFWKKQFEDYEEQFHLPTDLLEWEMSEQETPLAGVVEVSIANTDKKALNEFVRQHRLQLTSLCALAIGLVLGKHSRCTDFVIGMPAASRSHPQLKQMVGDFVNTLPLRLTLDYGQTALQQLQQLQAHFYSILEHQMYPFEYLLESIAYEQKAGQFPLFNVLLSFPNHQELHKSREQGMARRSLQAMYDLTWTLLDFGEDGLQLNLEYDARKYKEEKIRQMARQTKWVLQQLIQWPERNLSSITLWEESTAASFLATYSVGQKAFSPSPYASVLEAFSVQASRQAENVAIRSGQDQWTYAMMDRKIRQIAHKLIGLGIQKGDRVVVDVADSVQQILAMWGIWWSGAVYVPIDHKAPQFRKDWVAKDCRPSVSIGSGFFDSELWEGEMANAKEFLPTAPAYLLYTSGSSGRPKGVLVSHGSLLSKMEEECQLLQLDEQMIAYCITNSVFDVSLLERVLPICCGGSMAVPSESSFVSTADAIQDLLRDNVNILQGTPTYFSHFLSLLDPTSAQSLNEQLQHLCIGGESLNSVLVRKLKNHLPSTRLHNHYGPTETTIDAVAALDIVEFKENIIGRPFGQGRVGVIDEFDHFLPPTVIGELVIAGPGLAMGYWQDDALSNDKFRVHPAMGERIYRTGDLVCWTEEGQLKFIGRKDAQVKYRGYRIEPAEIAACIQDFPAVADAHVRVLGNSLVAWMVGDAIDKSALQDFLESQLPTYMIPGAMECIDFIPRTASGKVAVDQLPEPQQLQQGHVAARTAWEEKITAVWQEVLSVDQIGIYDNFFALGGHSLKAIGLIKLYHKYFGVKVKMRDIFRRTTVESQARLIQSLQKNHYSAIERLPVAADHAVSPAQKRLWILSQVQKASLAYNMPGKVRLDNRYTAEQLQQALYMVIDRFEILRTTFFENEQGELRQKIWQRSELSIPIDMADLTASLNPLAEVTDFIEQLSFEPFDLEKGPLLRACIFILPDEHLQLCFNMHHIISDGYSIDVLSENIGLALEAVKNGGEESLAPLSIQYKEYAHWKNAYLSSSRSERDRQYWLEKLQNIQTADLPSTYMRPLIKTFRGEELGMYLSEELSQQIADFATAQNTSPFIVLLTAMKGLLYRLTSLADITLGTSMDGRDHADLSEQIGFFINALALRAPLETDRGYADNVRLISQQVLNAFEHQAFPFDRLVDELKLKRDLSRNPVFDMMLSFQNNIRTPWTAAIDPAEVDQLKVLGTAIAKLDISLIFQQRGKHLFLTLNYNTDLFSRQAMQSFAEQYIAFLTDALAQPDVSLSKLNHWTPKQTTSFAYDQLTGEAKDFVEYHFGEAAPESRLHFLDENDQAVGPESLGRVWIESPGAPQTSLPNQQVFPSQSIYDRKGASLTLFDTQHLAYQSAEGQLVWKGPQSSRLFLRGVSVFLSEIEKVLQQHEAIRKAAICPHPEDSDLLLAFIVQDKDCDDQQLISHLQLSLPQYQIPHSFERVKELPLLPDRSIDFPTLIGKHQVTPIRQKRYVAPQTRLEKELTTLFEQVLETSPIGMEDNFFEIGGNSIKASMILARIHKERGVRIDVARIFSHPTIEFFAAEIERLQNVPIIKKVIV